MKVVTLRGTYEVDLEHMKVRMADGREEPLQAVPTPVIGERMKINDVSTEPVTEVQA